MADYNKLWAGLLIVVLFFISQQSPSKDNIPVSGVDLSQITSPTFLFRGQDLYQPGTSLASESVRIIESNGDIIDLGYKSLNSGTLSVVPGAEYTLYFFMNDTIPSTSYYVDKQVVTAEAKDSVTPLTGKGCAIDTRLIFSSYDTSGRRQTADSYAISLSATQMIDTSIRIQTYMDKCYGSPSATKGNAVCFGYDASYIGKVETDGSRIPTPVTVSNTASGKSVACYEFEVLKDGQELILPVHIEASASNEPTIAHNISVYVNDINYDLNLNTLAEIHGFEDEEGNDIGATVNSLGTIYIS